jgi:hypothetical protein
LVVEIASSIEAIDLHGKRRDYERAKVPEYLVVALRQARVVWLELVGQHKYQELMPDADGIHRSRVFPGLWLDAPALFSHDRARLRATLRSGLDSPEHHQFVGRFTRNRSQPQ